MKTCKHLIFLFILTSIPLAGALFFPPSVEAQTCLNTRGISYRRCTSGSSQCATWAVANSVVNCTRFGGNWNQAKHSCLTTCTMPNGGPVPPNSCDNPAYCAGYIGDAPSCNYQNITVGCNPAPACNAIVNYVTCTLNGAACSETTNPTNFGCWVTSTTPPAEQSSCTVGDCFTNVANCGEVGRENGAGSCTGGICCQPVSNYVPNCPYNVQQTGYYDVGGNCQWSEGNGCNANCRPPIAGPGSNCQTNHCPDGSGIYNFPNNQCASPQNGCADGLVGGGCECPSCNIRFSPKNITMTVGEIQNIDILNIPTNWRRYSIVYPIASGGDNFDERYDLEYRFRHYENPPNYDVRANPPTVVTARLRGDNNRIRLEALAVGTTKIEVRARYTGWSPRTICSKFITVAVTNGDVPCEQVTNVAVNQVNQCDNSATPAGEGNLRVTWNESNNATAYILTATNTTPDPDQIVYTQTVSPASCSNAGVDDEVCSFDIPNLPAGSYVVTVLPTSSGVCVPPGTGVSSAPSFPLPYCPATITAIGKFVASGETCANIISSTNYTTGLTFTMSGGLGNQTQAGTSAVSWTNVNPQGPYTIGYSIPPAGSTLDKACWTANPGGTSGQSSSNSIQSFQTLAWYLGFTPGNPWSRVTGGDIHVCQSINSPVGAGATPRYFMTAPAGGAPGIVTYGNDYDFDPDPAATAKGASFVSVASDNTTAKNWLVNESIPATCTTDWYQFLFNKYGLSGVPYDFTNPGALTSTSFPSRTQPYKVSGNLTTSGTWNIAAGDNRVIFVDGNLTIGGPILTPNKSFIAFVVNGTITVSPTVGSALADTTPDIQAVFVSNGSFNTGDSSNAATPKLIVNGSVIANDIVLDRDLGGSNNTTPAEEFRYNPMFIFTLPNEFLDMRINWQEVAP